MIYNLAHNGNKLITFTIDGTTYQAIKGMTWGEWVNSEYNTGGFYAELDKKIYVYNSGNTYISGVQATDIIIANSTYFCETSHEPGPPM